MLLAVLGALLAVAGAVAALWMIREGTSSAKTWAEGRPLEAEPEPASA